MQGSEVSRCEVLRCQVRGKDKILKKMFYSINGGTWICVSTLQFRKRLINPTEPIALMLLKMICGVYPTILVKCRQPRAFLHRWHVKPNSRLDSETPDHEMPDHETVPEIQKGFRLGCAYDFDAFRHQMQLLSVQGSALSDSQKAFLRRARCD